MGEKRDETPKLDYERFNDLSVVAQKLLIYFSTIPETSDISFEELASPTIGIAENEEEVSVAITDLEAQGLLHRGYNPLRKERSLALSRKEAAQRRFHVTPDVHRFVTHDLPQIWKEAGLI